MKNNNRILIIEDDASIRKCIAVLLELEAYEVHASSNGNEGLEQIMQWHPDLVICDIRMPGLNGFELLAQYSSKDEYTRIPFIFLSALSEKADIRAAMNLGADDYLTKPFTQAELLGAVRLQLAKKQKREVYVQEQCDLKVLNAKQEVQKERNVLLAEIHHRVKNNLALISALIQLQEGESQSDRDRLLNRRINAIALVHEEVYSSELFSAVNLQCLAGKMVSRHLQGFPHINPVLQLEAVELDISKAVPTGLLLHELLENAVVHAFPDKRPGEIQIKLYEKNGQLHLHFSDNGIGISEISCNKYSLGLTLVDANLKQLCGILERNSSPETGTAYKISFPI